MKSDLEPRAEELKSPPSPLQSRSGVVRFVDTSPGETQNHTVRRYTVHGRIASGGMASVHFGRLQGPAGFARTVAIKRLHPQFAEDPEFLAMLQDEARLAARIRHPNVVPTLDIVSADRELLLVMEYVDGETLSRLLSAAKRKGERMPVPVVAAILSGVLHGLHAAHEAKNELGEPLDIVHRDVSPQNILVGKDGVPRVVDFGVAKAVGRLQTTREGQIKGKLMYMAPELFSGASPTRQSDVYGAGVVLWEALAGRRLFPGGHEANVLGQLLDARVEPPSRLAEDVSPELDAVVMRALDRNPARRFATARDMAAALESIASLANPSATGAWVERIAAEELAQRAAQVAELENGSLRVARELVTDAARIVQMAQSELPTRLDDQIAAPRLNLSAAHNAKRWIEPRRPRNAVVIAVAALAAVVAGGVGVWQGSTSEGRSAQAAPTPPPLDVSVLQERPSPAPGPTSTPSALPGESAVASSSGRPKSPRPPRAAATAVRRAPAPAGPAPPVSRAPGVRFDDPG